MLKCKQSFPNNLNESLKASDIENVNWNNESCCLFKNTLILNWIYRGQKDVYEATLLFKKEYQWIEPYLKLHLFIKNSFKYI